MLERFEQRLKELFEGRDQAKANLIAHEGAIQETQAWIEKLKSEAKEG